MLGAWIVLFGGNNIIMPEGIIEKIKKFLFPIFCVNCGNEDSWWCRACQNSTPFFNNSLAPAPPLLSGLTALYDYRSPAPAALIQLFKYQYASDLARLWGEVIEGWQQTRPPVWGHDAVVIPVPLYPRRERTRGFNQAEKIAGFLARQFNLPMMSGGLARIRPTAQQARLTKEARAKNVRGAFKWIKNTSAPVSGLLVDDVYTTGATMQECALVLQSAGAKNVWGFVVARD